MSEHFSVAIDGPSGAGKSTLAKAAAERFGFIHADTGAIYRTVGLAVRRNGISSKDREKICALLPSLDIRLSFENGRQKMFLGAEDVSGEIRTPEISIYASDVSALREVRAFLMETQRSLAEKYDVVMDGRDIGTVVLPNADLKIFLTAAPEKRAERRLAELLGKGIKTTYEEVLRDIQYRDENDSTRSAAPLRAAEDAVFLDTSELTVEQSAEAVCELIRAAGLLEENHGTGQKHDQKNL